MNGVTKESWLNVSDGKERDALMYDMLQGIHNTCETRFTKIEDEHIDLATKFNRRKKLDTTASVIAGFWGGVTGFISQLLFFRQ